METIGKGRGWERNICLVFRLSFGYTADGTVQIWHRETDKKTANLVSLFVDVNLCYMLYFVGCHFC